MTKTAIMIFLLGTIFGSIVSFYMSIRFFSNFGYENIVLPSVDKIVVLSGENQKIKDQIVSEFRKHKSDISENISLQLQENIKKNLNAYIFGAQ